ncbi:MAG: acyl carrier protein [Patescibacteria group bacterium]
MAKSVEEVLAKVFNMEASKINDITSPSNTEAWDSFNGLLLVTELEKTFDVKFTIEEIVGVKTVADIKAVIRKHGVKLF